MNRIGVVLILILGLLVAGPVLAADRPQNEAALSWMRGMQQADGGFSNGFTPESDFGTTVEVILAAAAAGVDVSTWVSPDNLTPLDYVAQQAASGALSAAGPLSKALMVAVATGQDPHSFGGMDLVAALTAAQDPETGQFGTTLFEHAYAVLALTRAGQPVPASAVELVTSTITTDGAWSLFGDPTPGTADTNTTALVMQALVAAGRSDAAAGGLAYLHRMQNADGGFPYQNPSVWGTDTDANSTATVLQALYALDEPMGAWSASGVDPLGALLALWDAQSGAYSWQAAYPFANIMATAQAVQAAEGMSLVALTPVGASRAPQTAAEILPLLPESGGFPLNGLLALGSFALLGGALALRRRR